MHPERRRRTTELARLAENGDWQLLYQRLTLEEFGYEARMGWQLAFLRPFAVPRMAEILVSAGQLIDQPRKRAYDTGLIIYEIVYGGFESPRAKKMISLINRAHRGFAIEDEDMTYVLCSFMVCPVRHIDLLGWRRLTDLEREAGVRFFGRLGELMNIARIPRSYAEAAAIFDAYEAAHVEPSPSSRLLADNLMHVLKDMQPAAARPLTASIFTLLLNDARVAAALGLRPPPRLIQAAVRTVGRGYGSIQSLRPPSSKEVFAPGRDVPEMYPHGYQLSDLGPASDLSGESEAQSDARN